MPVLHVHAPALTSMLTALTPMLTKSEAADIQTQCKVHCTNANENDYASVRVMGYIPPLATDEVARQHR